MMVILVVLEVPKILIAITIKIGVLLVLIKVKDKLIMKLINTHDQGINYNFYYNNQNQNGSSTKINLQGLDQKGNNNQPKQ